MPGAGLLASDDATESLSADEGTCRNLLLRSHRSETDPDRAGGRRIAVEHFITHAVEQYGYLAIFLLMLLDAACIPIPSEVTMLFGGAFATTQVAGDAHLNFVLVCVAGVAGNLVGSWIAYSVGRVGKRPLAERWGRWVLIQPHDIDRAEVWFDRHGEAAVFFARMIPLLRSFISLPAGIAQMPIGTFTLYTVLGLVPWVVGLAAAGYALGTQWHTVVKYFLPITIIVGILIAAGIAWWIVRGLRARRAGQEAAGQP
jgi:membrane protein DedA with SNARE-associated domain